MVIDIKAKAMTSRLSRCATDSWRNARCGREAVAGPGA
jgi:hypothetical protein